MALPVDMADRVYKATVRLATAQYEFIEVEVEDTPEGILEAYRAFNSLTVHGDGITQAEFEKFVDNQLAGDTNQLETFQKMSPSQQEIVQLIKRSKKRVMYKLSKLEGKK